MEEQSGWKRMLLAALAIDGIFLLAALVFGFLNWQAILGLLLGTGYAVGNELALAYSLRQLLEREEHRAKRYYLVSYLLRFLAAGLVLSIGFAWLNPFAVFFPMLAPKAKYYSMIFKK